MKRFNMNHRNKVFECGLDEDGSVLIISKGKGGAEKYSSVGQIEPATDLEHAKSIAAKMLYCGGY